MTLPPLALTVALGSPSEFHLHVAGCPHELDVDQHVADIIPALCVAALLLNDGVHLATQCSLPVVEGGVEIPTNVVVPSTSSVAM